MLIIILILFLLIGGCHHFLSALRSNEGDEVPDKKVCEEQDATQVMEMLAHVHSVRTLCILCAANWSYWQVSSCESAEFASVDWTSVTIDKNAAAKLYKPSCRILVCSNTFSLLLLLYSHLGGRTNLISSS